MALRADLRGELVLVLEPGLADDARFGDAVDERLFAINMLAAVHCAIGDERVRVVERAADDGVNVFLFKAFSPVNISLGPRKQFGRGSEVLLVDVTDGHNI